MVLTFFKLIHGAVRIKVMAHQDIGLFKLGEHTVNRGKANFNALVHEFFVNVFCRQMAAFTITPFRAALEQFQNT